MTNPPTIGDLKRVDGALKCLGAELSAWELHWPVLSVDDDEEIGGNGDAREPSRSRNERRDAELGHVEARPRRCRLTLNFALLRKKRVLSDAFIMAGAKGFEPESTVINNSAQPSDSWLNRAEKQLDLQLARVVPISR